jgi:hypothetical protein
MVKWKGLFNAEWEAWFFIVVCFASVVGAVIFIKHMMGERAAKNKFTNSVPNDAICYGTNQAIWYDNAKQTLFYFTSGVLTSIPSFQIVKFEHDGQIYHHQLVSGGGTSFITGLNQRVSTTIKVDDRRMTSLLTKDSSHGIRTWTFPHFIYDYFIEWFPEKEGTVVEEIRRQQLIEKQLMKS